MAEHGMVRFDVDDRLPLSLQVLYGLQWVAFVGAQILVIPLVVAPALALSPPQLATMMSASFLVTGLASLVQHFFGHRLPVAEAPAGIWMAVLVTLATLAPALGLAPATLRAAMEFGLLAVGALLLLLWATRLVGAALRLFTPAVTGTMVTVLVIELAGPLLKDMLQGPDGVFSPRHALLAMVSMGATVWISLRGSGMWRSVGVLVGIASGWLLAFVLGVAEPPLRPTHPLALPQLFPFGRPVPEPGITLAFTLIGGAVLANLAAALFATGALLGRAPGARALNGAALGSAAGQVLAASLGSIGTVPYASSPGLVALTGVAARGPFLWFGLLMSLMGLVATLGTWLAAIPLAVGSAVALAAFTQLLAAALRDYARTGLGLKDTFVIGLSLTVGVGVGSLPVHFWQGLPPALVLLAGNGLIVGLVIAVALEVLLGGYASSPATASTAAAAGDG